MPARHPFQPAASVQKKAKVLVYGEPGVGKTWFALTFPRVALIDTEGGADLYGGRFDFDVLRTKSFGDILDAIEAVKADHGRTWQTLVIDPISIVWQVLQDAGQQAAEARAARYGRAADDVMLTPRDWGLIKRRLYSAMTDLVNLPVNVVLTAHLRDVMEMRRDGRGQEVAVKVGEKPDAEKRTGYWPDIVVRLVVDNGEHVGIVEKDRSGLFRVGQRVPNMGYKALAPLLEQHATGDTVVHETEAVAAQRDAPIVDESIAPADAMALADIRRLAEALGISRTRLAETLERDYGVADLSALDSAQAAALHARLTRARRQTPRLKVAG